MSTPCLSTKHLVDVRLDLMGSKSTSDALVLAGLTFLLLQAQRIATVLLRDSPHFQGRQGKLWDFLTLKKMLLGAHLTLTCIQSLQGAVQL